MLGFVGILPSARYVGLCGGMSISLIYWALWVYFLQSEMLSFVGILPSAPMLGFMGVYFRLSDMLGFVGILLSAGLTAYYLTLKLAQLS